MVEGWQVVYPQETTAKVVVFYVFHTHNILDYMSFNDQINTLKIYLLLMSRCSLSTTILVILLLDETMLMLKIHFELLESASNPYCYLLDQVSPMSELIFIVIDLLFSSNSLYKITLQIIRITFISINL